MSLIWCSFLDSEVKNLGELFHEQVSTLSRLHLHKRQKPVDYLPRVCAECTHVHKWVGVGSHLYSGVCARMCR